MGVLSAASRNLACNGLFIYCLKKHVSAGSIKSMRKPVHVCLEALLVLRHFPPVDLEPESLDPEAGEGTRAAAHLPLLQYRARTDAPASVNAAAAFSAHVVQQNEWQESARGRHVLLFITALCIPGRTWPRLPRAPARGRPWRRAARRREERRPWTGARGRRRARSVRSFGLCPGAEETPRLGATRGKHVLSLSLSLYPPS